MTSGYFWDGGVRYYLWHPGHATRAMVQAVSGQQRRYEEENGSMAEKTIHNPYYIGGSSMLRWDEQLPPGDPRLRDGSGKPVKAKYAKHTLQEALDAAERRLEDDPSLQAVSVVKIVRVVRRAKPVVSVDIEVVE